ncbi:type I-C CRISPR-associated protein Cas5 [Sphaerisporangium album]|uniref:pre-crRNA processing endonuclease n=1 Tax=Sphaerisporangium album TaxID=509200 RepID=A0A367FP36_9ACTN|nr:type I-C CRISPR-associated protein Cas5 [Sphaerisporangium album]
MEVQAPYACFTRPEFKTERLSYPVMTPSAAKGVLEAIFWKPEFSYRIEQIEVLQPIRWMSIRRNEVSSMLTVGWIREAMSDPSLRFDAEADRDQRNMVCLRDVAYRIHAQVRLRPHATDPDAKYRDQFRRRVERGSSYSQPFLGVREFSASFHPPTPRSPIPHDEQLGVMLHSIRYDDMGESYRWFHAKLRQGVLTVPKHGVELPTGQSTTQAVRTGGRS